VHRVIASTLVGFVSGFAVLEDYQNRISFRVIGCKRFLVGFISAERRIVVVGKNKDTVD
jgi:hypothetical protein